jgi:hypothetical protein
MCKKKAKKKQELRDFLRFLPLLSFLLTPLSLPFYYNIDNLLNVRAVDDAVTVHVTT